MSGAAAFQDSDMEWASSPRSPSVDIVGNGNTKRVLINEDFLDDFDDDDDAFFASTLYANGNDNSEPIRPDDSGVASAKGAVNCSSFGMLTLVYTDASPMTPSARRDATRPTTSPPETMGEDQLDEQDDTAELLELDRRYLSYLRDSNSSYQTVARSCLVLHQYVYSNDSFSSETSNQHSSIQIKSSSIYHIQQFQRRTYRIVSSLTKCMTTHKSASCRSLAARTLASAARGSYAKLHFDAKLTSVRLPPSIATRLEDECGNGVAYSLVVVALEDGSNAVSSGALEALGVLTLDPHCDSLSAEVRTIAECANPNLFMYENDSKTCWILEHASVMKELQLKAWTNVVFPRMQRIMHRVSLYSSEQHVSRAIPVMTAAFVHALTQGPETIPSRRAMQTGKVAHGKRGWMETDAESLAREYVEGVLIPCFDGQKNKALHRAAAIACIRMASACPAAPWRAVACRCAVSTLLQQLGEETRQYKSSSTADTVSSPIASSLSTSLTPMEAIAGTASLLLIALRGVPLNERAAGLIAAVRASLLYLPTGVIVEKSKLDVPSVGSSDQTYRLGRIGLLTEAALLVMLDGSSNIEHIKSDDIHETQDAEKGKEKEKIQGDRAILLNHILQSNQLCQVWVEQQKYGTLEFRPVDELVWTFCAVAIQIESQFKDTTIYNDSVEWSNIGLVLLDNFAKFVCTPHHPSLFANSSYAAFADLYAAMLKKSGLSPPSTISISDSMMPNSLTNVSDDMVATSSSQKKMSVVGGPGTHLPQVSSTLTKISYNVLTLWNKGSVLSHQHLGHRLETSAKNVLLATTVVDAWLGRCIMNHDAKQSNDTQLEIGPILISLLRSEMNLLLDMHSSAVDEDIYDGKPTKSFDITVHLFQTCIACVESVATMAVLLANVDSIKTKGTVEGSEKKVSPLALATLNGIVSSTKEGLDLSSKKGSVQDKLSTLNALMYQQIALDASDATVRITDCIHAIAPRSFHEDITADFQVSPLLSSEDSAIGRLMLQAMLRTMLSCSPIVESSSHSSETSMFTKLPSLHIKAVDHCAVFLYHHARLFVSQQVRNASNALAPTKSSSSPRLVRSQNPLRLSASFQHSTIEMYQRIRGMPLLATSQSTDLHGLGSEAVTLTGCSDPVSLTMSHIIRRVRKADLSEESILIVTMKLYNITAVPISNGVRLDLKVTRDDQSNDENNCTSTTTHNEEIKAGDFITWEICFGSWSAGNPSLQASVTFRDLAQESATHKWVSGGDEGAGLAVPEGGVLVVGDDEDELLDVTIACEPVKLSALCNLAPCPLVFFGGVSRCERFQVEEGGDVVAFQYLWSSMSVESELSFHTQGTPPMTVDAKRGCIVLRSKGHTGCAFVTPDGNRVLCTLYATPDEDDGSYTLCVRSNSVDTLQTLIGKASLRQSFVRFVVGNSSPIVLKSPANDALTEHDFPSITMAHSPLNQGELQALSQ